VGTFRRCGPRWAGALLAALLAACGPGEAGAPADGDGAPPDGLPTAGDDGGVPAADAETTPPEADGGASRPEADGGASRPDGDAGTSSPDASAPDAPAPRSAVGVTAAGGVTRSAHYRMVSSLGRPVAGQSTATSPRFRLQDGAAGGSR
jgi:hypothetical protein